MLWVGMVNKIDSVVEAIETVAEATEKTSSDFAGCLPDGKLKKVVFELEQASKIVVKDVQAIDTFIHKVFSSYLICWYLLFI